MWKLLTGVIGDQIYGHLDQQKLLQEEQKACRKRSSGTNDLLNIDKAVIKEVKFRKKNSMEKWRVMLCAGNSELGKVNIKRGIFQGDSLFSVYFNIDLIKFDVKKLLIDDLELLRIGLVSSGNTCFE